MWNDFQVQEGTELAPKNECVVDEREEMRKLTNN